VDLSPQQIDMPIWVEFGFIKTVCWFEF
jgi:hypothetical protein